MQSLLSSRNRPSTGLLSHDRRQPAGQRSGEGAGSVLPPLRDDAAARGSPPPGPANRLGGSAASPGATADVAAPRTIGKYLVSPLIKAANDGWFASSVSIRSGSGRGTSDRVLRMTRLFRCAREAAAYAHEEGLRWIGASRCATPVA